MHAGLHALDPKHIDDALKGIGTELGLHQRRQRVRPFTKIPPGGLRSGSAHRCQTDQRTAFSASITAAITLASAPRAIFTATPSISSSIGVAPLEDRRDRHRLGIDATTGAGRCRDHCRHEQREGWVRNIAPQETPPREKLRWAEAVPTRHCANRLSTRKTLRDNYRLVVSRPNPPATGTGKILKPLNDLRPIIIT